MDPVTLTLVLQSVFVLLTFWLADRRPGPRHGQQGLRRSAGAGSRREGRRRRADPRLLAVVAGTASADDRPWGARALLGTAAMLAGLVVTLAAQRAMGKSWRIGVDPDERTEVVTAGPFGRVRNVLHRGCCCSPREAPSPSPRRRSSPPGCWRWPPGSGRRLRLVEEPHLRRQHGAVYDIYARSTGRLVPGAASAFSGS